MQRTVRSLLWLLSGAIALGATAQPDTLGVRVLHGAACNVVVTMAQVQALPQHEATIASHDGEQATYVGAWLKDVLKVNCTSIAEIPKKVMVNTYVRVEAEDGYMALVALAEADSSFRERPIILAWKKNGRPMDDHNGPFQLIVPDDRRHARDVRKVTRLQVVTP